MYWIVGLIFLAICFAIKNNSAVMIGLVNVDLLCDLAWYLMLFPHGEYHATG